MRETVGLDGKEQIADPEQAESTARRSDEITNIALSGCAGDRRLPLRCLRATLVIAAFGALRPFLDRRPKPKPAWPRPTRCESLRRSVAAMDVRAQPQTILLVFRQKACLCKGAARRSLNCRAFSCRKPRWRLPPVEELCGNPQPIKPPGPWSTAGAALSNCVTRLGTSL